MIKMSVELTNDNFDSVVGGEKPVIVDFWAEWCGPCRMMAPVIEEISDEHEDIVVGKLNVDDEGDIANRYQVSAIPTVILFKDGKPVATSIGFKQKEELIKALGI